MIEQTITFVSVAIVSLALGYAIGKIIEKISTL